MTPEFVHPSWAVGVGCHDSETEMVAVNVMGTGLFLSANSARFMAQQLLLSAEKVDQFNTPKDTAE